MTFTITQDADAATWKLAGELDVAEADGLIDRIGGVSEGDVRLDLRELSFIDSSGVRAFVTIAGMLPMGSKLILHEPTRTVRRVLDLVGIQETAAGIELDAGSA
jgi:anti-anti-sigma factor